MQTPSWVGRRLREFVTRLDGLEHFAVAQARRLDALESNAAASSKPGASLSYTGASSSNRKAQYTMPTLRVGDPAGTLNLSLDDSSKGSAAADNTPVWTSDNTGVLTVSASSDGMSASVQAVSAGTANITVKVTDSDGTTFTVGPEVFTVETGEATSGTLTFTPPASSGTAPSPTTGTTPTSTTGTTPATTPDPTTGATPTTGTPATAPAIAPTATSTAQDGIAGTSADPTT